jgi:hypothetical protein
MSFTKKRNNKKGKSLLKRAYDAKRCTNTTDKKTNQGDRK